MIFLICNYPINIMGKTIFITILTLIDSAFHLSKPLQSDICREQTENETKKQATSSSQRP